MLRQLEREPQIHSRILEVKSKSRARVMLEECKNLQSIEQKEFPGKDQIAVQLVRRIYHAILEYSHGK